MNLQNWVEQAREHWKRFLPSRYREFEDAGVLDEALQEAANLTYREVSSLENAGMSSEQAWEMTKGEYLLLPPEPKQKAKMDREPSPNVAAQTLGPTQAFMGQMLQKMNGDDGAA
jgi:hypothetical protein